jgi:hypothetical protein
MRINLTGLILLCFIFGCMFSCSQKMICPAYQSTYILDEEKRKLLFSLFDTDSIPKHDGYVSKNKYGLIEHKKYRSRLRELNTVKMENVLPPKQEYDSLALAETEIAYSDQDEMEADILRQSLRRGNVVQEYYNEMFGQYLIKHYADQEIFMEEEIVEQELKDTGEAIPLEELNKQQKRKKKKKKGKEKDFDDDFDFGNEVQEEEDQYHIEDDDFW